MEIVTAMSMSSKWTTCQSVIYKCAGEALFNTDEGTGPCPYYLHLYTFHCLAMPLEPDIGFFYMDVLQENDQKNQKNCQAPKFVEALFDQRG